MFSVTVSLAIALRRKTGEMLTAQPVAKKLARVSGVEDYNVLQNNGRIAHQVVDHVSILQP